MKPLTPEQAEEVLDMATEKIRSEILEDGSPVTIFGYFRDWIEENTHSFEPTAVIYKGSGFTGAQKGERK